MPTEAMQQFLELFHPNPGNSYLLVTSVIDEVADALYEKTAAINGSFHIALYAQGKFPKAKVEVIDALHKPFKSLPREHDRVIFKDIFTQHKNPAMLLKLAYRALANAAEVIIVEPQGSLEQEATKEMLEAHEFRAPNAIENLLKGYDVFTARKMHMWGNGL